MSTYRIEQLEVCHREMFGDLVLSCQTPVHEVLPMKIIQPVSYPVGIRRSSADSEVKMSILENERRRASALVDELLVDIYCNIHNCTTDYNSATSGKSHNNTWVEVVNLREKDVEELKTILNCLRNHTERMNTVLVRQLKRRDALRRQQEAYCDVITKQLASRVPESPEMRFTIQPIPGESGFGQWAAAMKMVAQLPGGIPPEFRGRLWLTLAERHLASRGVNWPSVERSCFSEWSHPADSELGVQIVKDLHRTGCSLFCGEDGQENQALLKRVLLAYARWNKSVGYCQGFNMLAALILQVTDKCESDALKLMIYLIEGVLPDSYFADSLRGLSVDMAVFRELLRSKLPRLSKHLDLLQSAAKDGSRSYEPPLTNVFTMQWFLTLFCNCLPQPTVLRIWDLILLEGNEILLRTALAIWQVLAERILTVRSADEFYCLMGMLTRELLEFDLVDGNSLIKAVVEIGPLTELKSLRDHYLYNINPWGSSLPQGMIEKQLKLYRKQSIALDISTLKKQYLKLKQRQRQAHIIFSAAISRQPPPSAPVTINHLLLGKGALVPAKRIGPPQGAIPPVRQSPSTLYWKDAPKQTSSSSSSDTELCDEDAESSSEEEEHSKENQSDDNLPSVSDNILMKNDNTTDTSVKSSASEDKQVEIETSNTPNQHMLIETETTSVMDDTFDAAAANNIKESSESDDESFDFERFLADRVKCLKESSVDDEPDERINYARRNSERALQIIQENSLILHRILQCQSRLSPSPPPIHITHETIISKDERTDTTDTSSNSFSDYIESASAIKNSTLNSKQGDIYIPFNEPNPASITEKNYCVGDSLDFQESTSTDIQLPSPQYGSKYTSILEKSKSLDERYNTLILNMPSLKQSISAEKDIAKTIKDRLVETCEGESQILGYSFPSTSSASDKIIKKELDSGCESKSGFDSHECKTYPQSLFTNTQSSEFKGSFVDSGKYSIEDSTSEPSLSFPYYTKWSGENLTSPNKNPISPSLEEEKSSADEKETRSFFKTKTGDLDSTISFLDSTNSSTNLSLATPVDLDKFEYKLKDYTTISEDLEPLEETKCTNLSSYRSLVSETEPNTCHHYLQDTSNGNLCSTASSEEIYHETLSEKITFPKENTAFTKETDAEKVVENKKTLTLDVGTAGETSKSKSPAKSPLKSPNRVFNPFPVPLSSRQSKEVPIKLGLYKK